MLRLEEKSFFSTEPPLSPWITQDFGSYFFEQEECRIFYLDLTNLPELSRKGEKLQRYLANIV